MPATSATPATLADWSEEHLPTAPRERLQAATATPIAGVEAWLAHLDAHGIVSARHRRMATEGALPGGPIEKGFARDPAIVSDGAGQFAILRYGLYWIRAERLVHQRIPLNEYGSWGQLCGWSTVNQHTRLIQLAGVFLAHEGARQFACAWPDWEILEAVTSLPDQGRQAALAIKARIGEILAADEHAIALKPALDEQQGKAQRLLTDVPKLSVLLAHLLKWQYQPARRSRSWEATIRVQRAGIAHRLQRTPSLKQSLDDPDWWDEARNDVQAIAIAETGLSDFPQHCPWSIADILAPDLKPD